MSQLGICLVHLVFVFTTLSYCRENREHRVFQSLVQMVPGLANRILSSSDKEVRLVADLVCIPIMWLAVKCAHANPAQDSEGRFKCEIGRHQESEGCHNRLDHASRTSYGPPTGPEH
jgi:hypothetical protein